MVMDPLFKYDKKKKSLDTNNLTFLVCITFLVLQGSGKKKMFLLACLYGCKKQLNKNYFVCSPKNKNVPQNFSQGDKLSPSDQILAQTLGL